MFLEGLASLTSLPAWPATLATLGRPAWPVRLAKRAMLARLEGSCRTPIAALAELEGDVLSLRGLVASPDGKVVYETRDRASAADAALLGERVAETLLSQAGPDFVLGAG